MKTEWHGFDGGKSIGLPGSEAGVIVLDEENAAGARVTLERDGVTAPFAITCGIHGWMVHTHFLATEPQAREALQNMKAELSRILDLIPHDDDPDLRDKSRRVADQIAVFVERFA